MFCTTRNLSGVVLIICCCQIAAALAEPIKLSVGCIYGLSGPVQPMSRDFQRGAELAAKEINSHDRVHLDLHFEDSQWQAKAAVAAFRKLRQVNGIRIFHVLGSPMSLAVKPLTEIDGSLLITGAAHPELLLNAERVIRFANNAASDAAILAAAVADWQPKRVASIYIQNDWSQEFDQHFKAELAKLSATAYESAGHLPDEREFKSLLLGLLQSKPDVVVVNTFGPAAALVIIQLKELGCAARIIANNGLALSADALKLLADRKITGFAYQHYPAPTEDFIQLYRRNFEESPGFFAEVSYTTFELLAHATAAIKSADPSKLGRRIKQSGSFSGRFQNVGISSAGDIVIPTMVSNWLEDSAPSRSPASISSST